MKTFWLHCSELNEDYESRLIKAGLDKTGSGSSQDEASWIDWRDIKKLNPQSMRKE